MNILRKLLVFALFLAAKTSFSQSEDKIDLSDTKTLAYGLTTNTSSSLIGGAVLRSSMPKSIRKNRPVNQYIAVEAVNLKNSREKNTLSPLGSKFVFGKLNYLFSVRPEYGREFYVYPKGPENSIGFSLIAAVGPSIGLVKPYYIKYVKGRNEAAQTVPYNPDVHVNIGQITGAGSIFQNFFTGIKMNPGAHAKIAANFDMNSFNNNVTGLEVGTVFELFSKRTEIMASKFANNPQAFATVYLTLYLGNKKLLKKKPKL